MAHNVKWTVKAAHWLPNAHNPAPTMSELLKQQTDLYDERANVLETATLDNPQHWKIREIDNKLLVVQIAINKLVRG